jgi:GNAT superfamily N-acetyltransferase
MLEQDMAELDKFLPPTGRLLLALQDQQYVGIGCLRKIGEDIGEIKRMYVRPSYRGTGIGRAILQGLVEQARQIGYTRIRLDSARFMKEAHAMYRSAGFTPIEPYAESEIPPEFRRNWIFMELYL